MGFEEIRPNMLSSRVTSLREASLLVTAPHRHRSPRRIAPQLEARCESTLGGLVNGALLLCENHATWKSCLVKHWESQTD